MKYIRKLTAIILTLALCSQIGIPCFAYSISAESNLVDVSLSMIVASIMNDPDAKDIKVTGNTLTYKMFGAKNVKITETVNNNGVRYLDIIEGEIHNSLSIDITANEMTLDGEKINVLQSISHQWQVVPDAIALSNTVWVYSGTRNVNVVAEDAIKNLAVNTLLTLLLSALGGIGVTLSVANLVLDAYKNLTSKTVYVTRTTYFEENYWAYKYIDNYYSNASRTSLIDTITTEHWE